jgi:hypothetical protein
VVELRLQGGHQNTEYLPWRGKNHMRKIESAFVSIEDELAKVRFLSRSLDYFLKNQIPLDWLRRQLLYDWREKRSMTLVRL